VENLRLDSVKFQPPCPLLFKAVMLCKNVDTHFKEEFNERIGLFSGFVERTKEMTVSPWQSVDESFAGGCIYPASNKVAHSLYEVMESLRDIADRMTETKRVSEKQSGSNVSMEPFTNLNFIGFDDIHVEG
jgi:hypothetical protein